MTIKERLINDVKDAMRAKDQNLVTTLRMMTAAVKQIEIDERVEADDTRVIPVLDKMVRQRQESITQFELAKRDDLVQKEQFELATIRKYLPEPLTEQEIEHMINEAITASNANQIKDMGKVMGMIKDSIIGRADLAKVSAQIKAKLS